MGLLSILTLLFVFVFVFVSSLYPYRLPHKGGIVVSRLTIMVYVNGIS